MAIDPRVAAMNATVETAYEFGPFRLEVDQRRLWKEREQVALPPKVFDTLTILVENGGRLVAKSELMARLWPGTAVEEVNLARNISDLRKLLGEGLRGAHYIETVPKKGYRWVAEVRVVSADAVRSPVIRRRPWIWAAVASAAAIISASIAFAFWQEHRIERSEPIISERPPNESRVGLLGTTVTQHLQERVSNSVNTMSTDVFTVVEPGIEIVCPGPHAVCGQLSPTQKIDFRNLAIRYEYSGHGATFDGTPASGFNGFAWENVNPGGGGIGGISLTTNIAGLSRDRLAFTRNTIRLNMQGLTLVNKSFFELDLSVAAPKAN
ncbi:MAG TPA: winged helix-turn-helix domain-containing protein [Bryobacteraceae bacterium]|nr:winged helix-turn-helix domain-containing protein [Bryobacteraceae bacterium]